MRTAIAAAVACFIITGLSAAQESSAAIKQYELNIPRQSLDGALKEFAQQTGLQVARFSDTIDGSLEVGPLTGNLSAEQALVSLLSPKGLAFKMVNDRTIAVINPVAPPSTASAGTSKTRPATGKEAQSRDFWERFRLAQTDLGQVPNNSSVEENEGRASERKPDRALQEVVVTAQKREELLRDVPISISVLNGADLDKSTAQGLTEQLNRVPGVAANAFSVQGGGTNLAMRGVTASGPLFNGPSPIAYYVDAVPFGLVKSAVVPDANAYDLDRVEVLRGPQGTLYGASAQNGVVRVLTKDADPDAFVFKARASGTSTKRGEWGYRGDAAINVPIVDGKVAARAVLGYQDLGGWIDKPDKEDVNDGKLRNMRFKLNAQPTEQLSVGLSAWLSRADYDEPALADHDDQSSFVIPQPESTDYNAYGFKVGYEFAPFSVSSSTSYMDYTNGGSLDVTPFGAPFSLTTDLDSEVISQEIVLSSTHEGQWRWSLGGMYRDAEDRLQQALPEISVRLLDQNDTSKSFAIFGEVTREFLDGRFEVTTGLRYFEDDVTTKENLSFTGDPAAPLIRNSDSFHATTPRVVLNWHPRSQLTAYASYAEGFRSGFEQFTSVTAALPDLPLAEPDKLKNYEVGMKGVLWGGRADFEAAVYFMDWQDVQQSVLVFGTAALPVTAVVNGESASGTGFDLGVTTEFADGLELGVSVSWNDLAMDSPLLSGGVVLFDEGDRLNISAEWTVGASADYDFALGGSGFRGRFSASANYTSEQDFSSISAGSRVIASGEPILVARTSFSIEATDGWVATLFADNVNNERGTPLRSPFAPLPTADIRIRPRTIGMQVEYRF